METLSDLIKALGHMPIEHLLGLIALAALALAAFAIHAVSSEAKDKERK